MKMRNFAFPALLVILALSAGCSKGDGKTDPKEIVVAVVNGEEIRGDLFLEEYHSVKKRLKLGKSADAEVESKLREAILERLTYSVLLLQQAEKSGIDIKKADRDGMVDQLLGGFSPARLQLILEKNKSGFDVWKEKVEKNMVVEALIQKKIVPMVDVGEAELRSYYKDHKEEFKTEERVHAYHIVLPTISEADEVRNEVVYGGDFDEMARKYSTSPDGKKGGDLGIFARGQMPLEFDNVVFDLRVRQISRVVESPYGYHVFKVVKKFKPEAMKFKDARDKIFKKLFYERLEIKFVEWLKSTKRDAKITVFTDRLFAL
jgi:parvulin-like peptidyl-prolyl isomerase